MSQENKNGMGESKPRKLDSGEVGASSIPWAKKHGAGRGAFWVQIYGFISSLSF